MELGELRLQKCFNLGDVFYLILFGNILADVGVSQLTSESRHPKDSNSFGKFYSPSSTYTLYYAPSRHSTVEQNSYGSNLAFYAPNNYHIQGGGPSATSLTQQYLRQQPLLPSAQLPLVPSTVPFPGVQSSRMMSSTHTVFTPDITQQRKTGTVFNKNYGNSGMRRSIYENHNENNEQSERTMEDNDSDSVDSSSEWVFDPNSRRVSSNEWEFSEAKSAQRRVENTPNASVERSLRANPNNKEITNVRTNKRALCMSPGCQTWITINIPEHGSIEGNIAASFETKISRKTNVTNGVDNNTLTDRIANGSNSSNVKSSSNGSNTIFENLTRSSNGGGNQKKKTKNRPTPAPIIIEKSITNAELKGSGGRMAATTFGPVPERTTRRAPTGFIFSTSWLLSLKRITVSPLSLSTEASSTTLTSAEVGTDASGGGPVSKNGEEKNGAVQPFTLKPKSKNTPGAITSATLGPHVGGAPKNPLSATSLGPNAENSRGSIKSGDFNSKKTKPWTHSSVNASRSTPKKKAKHRPSSSAPLSPSSPNSAAVIEEAAIWASTELIDAIREALEKFRAALYRANTGLQFDPEDAETQDQLMAKIEETIDEFKKGSWLERTMADAVLNDASLITNSDEHTNANALLNAILPSLLMKLEDDPPEHGIEDLLAPASNEKPRQRRDSLTPISIYRRPAEADLQKKSEPTKNETTPTTLAPILTKTINEIRTTTRRHQNVNTTNQNIVSRILTHNNHSASRPTNETAIRAAVKATKTSNAVKSSKTASLLKTTLKRKSLKASNASRTRPYTVKGRRKYRRCGANSKSVRCARQMLKRNKTRKTSAKKQIQSEHTRQSPRNN